MEALLNTSFVYLHYSAWAVTTKYHNWVAQTIQIYFLTVLEIRSKCRPIQFLLRALFLACRWPRCHFKVPSYCVFKRTRDISGVSFSSYEGSSPIELGFRPYSLILVFFISSSDTVTVRASIYEFWGWLGDINSVHSILFIFVSTFPFPIFFYVQRDFLTLSFWITYQVFVISILLFIPSISFLVLVS